jgi:hypothetical protein
MIDNDGDVPFNWQPNRKRNLKFLHKLKQARQACEHLSYFSLCDVISIHSLVILQSCEDFEVTLIDLHVGSTTVSDFGEHRDRLQDQRNEVHRHVMGQQRRWLENVVQVVQIPEIYINAIVKPILGRNNVQNANADILKIFNFF